MRYDLDAEFLEDGQTIRLISLGVVAEDGREFYAENADFHWPDASEWLLEHVQPHLSGGSDARPYADIGPDLVAFVGGDTAPEFWGWFADYDWIVLCQLFGTMLDLPAGWPMFCRDAKQLHVEVGSPVVPAHIEREHHALDDARHQQAVRLYLERRRPAALFYNDKRLALLGASLIAEIWARLDFEARFGDVSGVVLADDARPWLRPQGPVAVARDHSAVLWSPRPGTDPEDTFAPLADVYSFETSLDMDDMTAWAWGATRSDVVESCVEWLEEIVRKTIAGLFDHTDTSATYERAELAITMDTGPGELMAMVLPSNVTVVYRPDGLVVAAIGALLGGAAMVDGGERCVIRGSLKVSACLVLSGARRLQLAAPGPVSIADR